MCVLYRQRRERWGQVRDITEKMGKADTEKGTEILRQRGKLWRDRLAGESGPREEDQADGRHST